MQSSVLSVLLMVVLVAGCTSGQKSNDPIKGIAALSEKGLGGESVTVELKTYFQQAWDLALNVIKRKGVVTLEDAAQGLLKANIRDGKVEVLVSKASEDTIRIEIRSMIDYKPSMELSQEIADAIKL